MKKSFLVFFALYCLSFSIESFATTSCEFLKERTVMDYSLTQISSCRFTAKSNSDHDNYVYSFKAEILYTEYLDEFKTGKKLAAGLLDESALESYLLKYNKLQTEVMPLADKGNLLAIEMMYGLFSGNDSSLGPISIYKSMLGTQSIPNYAPFDGLLDDDKAFNLLSILAKRDEKKYLKPLAEAYFDGIGTASSWPTGLDILRKSVVKYDNEQSVNILAYKIIALGNTADNQLGFLAFGRALMRYSYYIKENDSKSFPSIFSFAEAFKLAAKVRGFSDSDVSNSLMIEKSNEIYSQLINRDFEILNQFVELMIKITKQSGM
jgi:hypothetical protein